MAFIRDQEERKVFPSKYVRLDERKPVIVQILQEESPTPDGYYKFWVKDSTGQFVAYVSPGYNTCPLTQRNIAVGKDSKQYIRPTHKYAINVLDITPVIRCPECNTPHRPDDLATNTENLCSNCSTVIDKIKPEPCNEVRILERGVQLFGQLGGLAGDEEKNIPPQVLNAEGTPLKINQYPVTITRIGTGSKTNYTVIPHPGHPGTVDPDDYTDNLLDIPDLGFDLSPSEILAIIDDGVPLSEILQAREGTEVRPVKVSEDEDDTLY